MSAFEAPHNPVRGGMEEVPPPISIPVFTTEEGSVSVDDYRYVASVVQGNTFTVDVRYDFNESKILGRSSWGVVCSVWDRVEQQAVALRRYRPYADDDWDARGLLRELRILKLFKLHPNVSFIISHIIPSSFHTIPNHLLYLRARSRPCTTSVCIRPNKNSTWCSTCWTATYNLLFNQNNL